MDMGLTPRIRAPREGPVGEQDLHVARPQERRPQLPDLFALRDRIGRDEADLGRALVNILGRLEKPRGDIIQSPAAAA